MKALVVDDDAGVRYTLRGILEEAGIIVEDAPDGEAALARVKRGGLDLVVSDLRMPRMDGMELLRCVQALADPPKVIMVTAHGSERHAVEAMKAGAYDYFRKPYDVDELVAVVDRVRRSLALEADNERLRGELHLSRSLVFASAAMSRLAVLIQRVAPRDVTVLITGESGTGKERVAEAIVRGSARAEKPFVRFNCAAITPDLAEAELFGHARGAFTGAHRARPGLFREADGGTLLLDEIGELDAATQAKLLRVLQEGDVRPVGEEKATRVDVRVVAATHRDLARMVSEGKFREDLYYRIKVVTLQVPPLRERPEDIGVLARHFLARFAVRFGAGALQAPAELFDRLAAWSWPGNVRELENAIESMVALSHDGEIDLSILPTSVGGSLDQVDAQLTLKQRMDAYERGVLAAALLAARGNRSEAARLLGIGRATLHEKLRKHRLPE